MIEEYKYKMSEEIRIHRPPVPTFILGEHDSYETKLYKHQGSSLEYHRDDLDVLLTRLSLITTEQDSSILVDSGELSEADVRALNPFVKGFACWLIDGFLAKDEQITTVVSSNPRGVFCSCCSFLTNVTLHLNDGATRGWMIGVTKSRRKMNTRMEFENWLEAIEGNVSVSTVEYSRAEENAVGIVGIGIAVNCDVSNGDVFLTIVYPSPINGQPSVGRVTIRRLRLCGYSLVWIAEEITRV